MIHYICKYTPVEIFAGFGEEAQLYNSMFENLDLADHLIHRNVCSFSRALITGRLHEASKPLVLTDCCDSIRRAYDLLKEEGQDVYIIYLPRKQDERSVALYKNEILKLIKALEKGMGREFHYDKFLSAFYNRKEYGGKGDDPNTAFHNNRLCQKPHVIVAGARIGEELLEKIRKISPLPVVNHTCTGLRSVGKPPTGASFDQILEWYTRELLSQTPCMRMNDISSRKGLLDKPNIRGIIYNTINFCDYYGFEYAAIRDRRDIPMVKIESDFTTQGAGQILTRLGAFFEGLNREEVSSTGKITTRGDKEYFAGIDSGSTSTNVVILDGNKNIVSSYSVATGARVNESANRALEEALKKAGIGKDQIKGTVTTGYGRNAIGFRERDITEITCHAKGAYFLNPKVRTIIDIGGQDSKIIRLNDRGEVQDFVMNDKCAAGTGRFLEMMATSLGLTLEEMGVMGLSAKEKITISSMCSVFAQSEVVSLVASGKNVEDIVGGINRSIAAKITALAGRSKLEREWMMTGGVARNPGVVAAIEERLQGRIIVPEEPEICGALGAALFAYEGKASYQNPSKAHVY